MKRTNRILFICAMLCLFCVGSITVLIAGKLNNKTDFQMGSKSDNGLEVENNLSKSLSDKTSKSYMLKLDNSRINAYAISKEGEYKLWNSTPVSPDISNEERNNLKKGIIVNTFEELCLYFESYSS